MDYIATQKVYDTAEGNKLSILDMLDYFKKRGAMRVSDLHIKVGSSPAYRVDGDLMKINGPKMDVKTAEFLIFPLLSEKEIEVLKTGYSIDTSYSMGNLQFRINIFKEKDGLCAAIRALSMDIPKVETVGFPNDIWKDIINRTHGLVLLTGITGAGKSTTIASLIDRISEKRACRIISLEDPIEYVFKQKNSMISQREVGRDVADFSSGLKAILREDPDVIFVGEMRDQETISMTLMAAETGHLVFSTLHTRDSVGSITRILDYFPPQRQSEVKNQLSLGLAYVICQKLIPKKDGTGRLIAMEILNNNYATANLIRVGKLEQIYSQLQTKTKNQSDEYMITLESHLARLVKQNKIDILEAQRWSNDPKTFRDAMGSYSGDEIISD